MNLIPLYNTIAQGKGIQMMFNAEQQRIELTILTSERISDDEFERLIELILSKQGAQYFYIYSPHNLNAAQRLLSAIDPLIVQAVVVTKDEFVITDNLRILWYTTTNPVQNYIWALQSLNVGSLTGDEVINTDIDDDPYNSSQQLDSKVLEDAVMSSDEIEKYRLIRNLDKQDPYHFHGTDS